MQKIGALSPGILIIFISGTLWAQNPSMPEIQGVLRHLPSNPNYFTDDSGEAIFLTGSHTWENFQDIYSEENMPKLDWEEYLNMMEDKDHNFMRFWVWEHPYGASWSTMPIQIDPMPYRRTGPGLAFDNLLKFDLTQWNEQYFQRLRDRVIEAGQRGIYVSIMLFQGWSLNKMGLKDVDPFNSHPFNLVNNINGVEVAEKGVDKDGHPTLHSLDNPKVLAFQEAYVKKVIESVNDLDNVLYEIINEGGTIEWCYHMIRYIREVEAKKPKQHMIGLGTRITPTMLNKILWDSPADYISPTWEPPDWAAPGADAVDDYGSNPPINKGDKVCIIDTDHLWGYGGNYVWAWKSFLRGLNPIFMDSWKRIPGKMKLPEMDWAFVTGGINRLDRDYPDYEPLRDNMGYINRFAKQVDLKNMKPHADLSTTRYCLANPGQEYLIYFPPFSKGTVNLSDVSGDLDIVWFIPSLNKTVKGVTTLKGGYFAVIEPPVSTDAILYL
ncbi:MAG: DUF4038 domain-containing protein, partial [Saprospiraceae bacterium]|nr:DUF4038 domain-containing protein [Saprospiraceae bacterium]